MEIFGLLLYILLLFQKTSNYVESRRSLLEKGYETVQNNECDTNRLTTLSWESESTVNTCQLLPAGKEGSFTYYVARMKVGDKYVNGKSLFIGSKHIIYVTYLGKEVESQEFEVLVAPPEGISWVKTKFDNLDQTWIVGGTDPIANECMFICRAFHGNRVLLVGKGLMSAGVCNVGIGNKVYNYTNYEVLVINGYGRSIGLQDVS